MTKSILWGTGFRKRRSFAAAALPLIASALFVFLFSTAGARAASEGCGEAGGFSVLPSPIAPWKGAPLRVIFAAEKPHRWRAFADRARWKRRGQFARAARWAALFLVCRGRLAGRRNLAREAGARRRPPRCSTVTRDIAVPAHEPPQPRQRPRQPLAGAQRLEPRNREPLFRLDREAVRRAARRSSRRGRRCTRCCATARAISCSTIWACAKTRWESSYGRTAPTFRISCAPISHSRWGCRSAIRNARAAAAAQPPKCHEWWNIQNLEPRARRRPRPRLSREPRQAAACSTRSGQPRLGNPSAKPSGPEIFLAPGLVRPLSAGRRRRRAFRIGADGGERRQHRLLSRAAHAGHAAPGHGLRRSLWARSDAGAARGADAG